LAEQAKILFAEAEENHLDNEAKIERSRRWYSCSLCEQEYHGVVRCALSWACWKTYLGRLEADWPRRFAINQLGNGLSQAKRHNEALSVQEAELATFRRLDDSEDNCTLTVQSNLASTYDALGRYQDALRMSRDVYSATLKLNGKEDHDSLLEANNYARSLCKSKHFEEAKVLLRKTMPIARRFLGESHKTTLRMRWTYVMSLYNNTGATLDDVREAVTTLEDTERIARRVLGGAHPLTVGVGESLRVTRAGLRARETPPRRRRVKTQARMATRGIWQPK
jgi:tetratricopeptide (TPR) repeat protein